MRRGFAPISSKAWQQDRNAGGDRNWSGEGRSGDRSKLEPLNPDRRQTTHDFGKKWLGIKMKHDSNSFAVLDIHLQVAVEWPPWCRIGTMHLVVNFLGEV